VPSRLALVNRPRCSGSAALLSEKTVEGAPVITTGARGTALPTDAPVPWSKGRIPGTGREGRLRATRLDRATAIGRRPGAHGKDAAIRYPPAGALSPDTPRHARHR